MEPYLHEVSIAMSLVEELTERANSEGADRIITVRVRIGAMAGVVVEALQFAWDIATEGTPAEGARLLIEEVPLVVFCPQCDAAKTISGHPILVCPDCGTLTPTIVRGRELQLIAMEVPDAAPAR
ncbi:MAG: hydrogenase maturation nickel metallochaperone HypA [Candidatus Eremiobacteraeota bacterium]|nr:hydrogenase maturation nickel metallochaperone HypA [Candidatus Eremiobacteraeota bacterium]